MAKLYGKNFTADELSSYVGRMEQVAGVERFDLSEGKARGVRAARVYTGSGFEFTVLLDRAGDISIARYNGAPLNWVSQAGVVAPQYYESSGKEWDRSFFGGLNATCGLRSAGHDSVVAGEAFGLHGRISATPAEDVRITTEWRGDDYVIEIKLTAWESHSYMDNLRLTRTITTSAGAKSFVQRDEVTNEGNDPTAHTIMYHVNPGFPVLTERSKVLWSLQRVEETTEEEFVDFSRPGARRDGGGYFFHKADIHGRARTAVVNPDFDGGSGLGVYIAYDNAALPVMVTWRQMARRAYLVGIEPANCRVATNAVLAQRGELPMLAPGEKRVYEIEFGALSGPEEIRAFQASLP